MPRPKAVSARARRDEWEVHRREIYRLFVVEKVSVPEMARYMKNEYGFDKTPKDYEYPLRKWKYRHNLSEMQVKSLHSAMLRRAGRQNEFVVSGIIWPDSMISGRLRRHESSRLPSDQFEDKLLPDFLARVQTPSLLMSGLPEWPKELPWIQFNESIHQALATLATPPTAGRMRRPQEQLGQALLVRMMHPCITTQNPLETNEPLEAGSINPPRRMRAMLEMVAPQAHAGDHENTAEILHNGSYESVAAELIRLLIYCESNNMVERFRSIIGCGADFSVPSNMMGFLRRLGFLTKANIKWLAGRTDPASQIFLNRLLAHSIIDYNSMDVLGLLVPDHFGVNQCMKIHIADSWELSSRQIKALEHEEFSHYDCGNYRSNHTLLELSCLAGNTNAVKLLLGLGADPYGTSAPPGRTLLEAAACLQCHERSTTITNLLLSKQTRPSPETRKVALQDALLLAIAGSHTKLIVRLLSECEQLGVGTICSRHFTVAAKYANCATIRMLVELAARRGEGTIQLPGDILFYTISSASVEQVDHDQRAEKFNYLLSVGANPAVPSCIYGCIGSSLLDVLIQSTMYGAMSTRDSERVECVLQMIKTILKHGCPLERSTPTPGRNARPSALQLAVAVGCPQLVECLLDWGANIDFLRGDPESERSTTENCDLHKQEFDDTTGLSPLLTALKPKIRVQSPEIAKMLLRRKPNLKLRGGEEHLAMKCGDDPELVAMLLRAGTADVARWKTFFEQAVLRRNPESIKFLFSMETNGLAAAESTTIMQAALITGDYNRACQQATVCGYDSRTLFEAVVQSHLHEEFHVIVERLLQMRTNTSNDEFEIRAVAFAAINHDTHLFGCLMESFGQGPWFAEFPIPGDSLASWVPDGGLPKRTVHILSYVALDRQPNLEDEWPLKQLLEANVPANELSLFDLTYLSAEKLNQLIAGGLNLNTGLLVRAVQVNNLTQVQALCEAKANLSNAMHNSDLSGSRTAMQVAIESGSPEMLQLLLRYGADVDGPCGYDRGATCLQLAAGQGNIGLVRFLLDKGANVNAKRSLFYGRTAVEIAAENGRLDVLKLLLMQLEGVCQSAAERYQFIRAAKLAEQNGHGVLAKMLRQHIQWNSDDQRLFDEIRDCRDPIFHLDDMTQKVSDSDRREDVFWSNVDEICRKAHLEDIYDIDGMEQWIGEDDRYSVSESDFSSEGELEANVYGSDSLARAGQRVAEYEEPASDRNQPPELKPMHVETNDAITCSESLRLEPISEQPGTHFQTLRIHPAPAQEETALAPRATRRAKSSSQQKQHSASPQTSPARLPRSDFGNADANTVAEALEIARDSPDGARDPVVSGILESALTQLWGRITAQPDTYVMSTGEFAVFNFYQHRFVGNEVAFAARRRFWDERHHVSGSPGQSETGDDVGSRTSSASESEETIYDGTTWYGPTWFSTASDPALILDDTYPYIALEADAVKKVIHAYVEHQGNSNRTGGQGTQTWSPSTSTSASQADPGEGSSWKRKLEDDQTQREQGTVTKKGRKQVKEGQPRLACHFQKMNPVKWARCGMREGGFARISDIKQHFRRHHMRNPNYCPICGSMFPSEERKNDHIRQSRANPAICPESSTPHLPEGLSHDELRALTERVQASVDISGQWYSIWAILFPDVAPPPTYTYDLSDRLHNSVRDLCLFLETEGPAIGQSVLDQENVIIGPSCNAANVDWADFNMELFTRRVLSRVFHETVQSWIQSPDRNQHSDRRDRSTGQAAVAIPLTPVSGSNNDSCVSAQTPRSTAPL